MFDVHSFLFRSQWTLATGGSAHNRLHLLLTDQIKKTERLVGS